MNPPKPAIRILIVQKHNRAIARAALLRLLQSHARFEVVGQTAQREDALRLAIDVQPDIILLDACTCDDGELELLAALIEGSEAYRVVLLTEACDSGAQRRAIGLGALGLVRQEQEAEVLFKAIECVHAGEIWLERTMMASVLQEKTRPRPVDPHDPQSRLAALSAREREVIVLVCEGLKNQAIADRLIISEATVRHALTSIFTKLRINDRLELVIFAYKHGLVQLPF